MRARARHRGPVMAIAALVCSLAGAAPVTDVDGNGTGSATVSATGTAPKDAVTATGAADHAARPVGDAVPPTSVRLDLSPSVVKSAIAAADADYAPPAARGRAFGTATSMSPSTPQTRIDRSFEAAQIETCGGAGTFKFDPPMIGPIGFGGLFAMPFLVHAMATGRCKL
jgi:hypothetical protein